MKAEGKLFFDFETNGSLNSNLLEACRTKVDGAIDGVDGWNEGNNERNKWLCLWDVETEHAAMPAYINTKLANLPSLNAVVDPNAPIAYCYSGNSRICYHPHTLTKDGQVWIETESGITMKIIIVLAYKTIVFPIQA